MEWEKEENKRKRGRERPDSYSVTHKNEMFQGCFSTKLKADDHL